MKKFALINIFYLLPLVASAQSPDWSATASLPGGDGKMSDNHRANIYQHSPREFEQRIEAGKKHALFYPVTVSDLLIPYRPLKNFFETDPQDPVRRLIYDITKMASPFKSMREVYAWLGVHEFPKEVQPEAPYSIPHLTKEEQELPMGATLINTPDGVALTFGCAACHSADLFGVKVLGLTNKFPRANEFFRYGKTLSPYVNSFIFKEVLDTTEAERQMLVRIKKTTRSVGVVAPQALGLDTSLAQVALSLARREQDEYATRTTRAANSPRKNWLDKHRADSKPAVWWNAKYKTRWLSDGSIISGNPVHTNFLWNEIGRGTDLKKLEGWLVENQQTIDDLTAAVFAAKPPRYEAFFGEDSIDIEKAKRGQKHFVQSCQGCHGIYEKNWDRPNSEKMKPADLVKTYKVWYHKKTPVKNVGTDPGRYLGMKAFADDLNRLQISKTIGTVVVPQDGYVPPPLEGAWSRYPYFHNNSVPNLCALLTPASKRPKTYWAGPAVDKARDYDHDCVGYPLGEKTPAHWKKKKDYFFDTKLEGLSNSGHDEKIFMRDGVEIYNQTEKKELIEFIKTL